MAEQYNRTAGVPKILRDAMDAHREMRMAQIQKLDHQANAPYTAQHEDWLRPGYGFVDSKSEPALKRDLLQEDPRLKPTVLEGNPWVKMLGPNEYSTDAEHLGELLRSLGKDK